MSHCREIFNQSQKGQKTSLHCQLLVPAFTTFSNDQSRVVSAFQVASKSASVQQIGTDLKHEQKQADGEDSDAEDGPGRQELALVVGLPVLPAAGDVEHHEERLLKQQAHYHAVDGRGVDMLRDLGLFVRVEQVVPTECGRLKCISARGRPISES